MAEIVLNYSPGLTVQALFRLFQGRFGNTYQVYETRRLGRDFVVEKNKRATIGVALKQEPGRTSIVLQPFSASMILNILVGSYVASIVLRPGWKRLERELDDFIRTSPDLGQPL